MGFIIVEGSAGKADRVAVCPKPGVGALVDDLLLCCDTKSLPFPKAVLSRRSGDGDWLRLKSPRGGDFGDSTRTEGASLGEDWISIDMGLLLFERVGESGPLPTGPGVRGTLCESGCCSDQGDVGRGRSKEALIKEACLLGSTGLRPP